jgi:hypothetical protein
MKIDQGLKRWVLHDVNEELEHNFLLRRKDMMRDVLMRYVRAGDAERYVRPDGHMAWRATNKFREQLREAWEECSDHEDAVF